ncbi:beta-lactamase-like protein [Phaeosphaeria sp. MPI-PUGE-AT-0046c]|nr:beta-lactamase-like protein [Phaeosphaeria sp. MPI-PUGE-AT-0046c]
MPGPVSDAIICSLPTIACNVALWCGLGGGAQCWLSGWDEAEALSEFPQLRIDYFRQQPDYKAPLACFLSHVHSDHLVGLESMRAPFVYCSAATKEILLRLEKYHYRINYAKGILESRNVTYDRSMRKLAKPLPLDTPTMIELAPGNSIRVTLIDANHCIGAVMFLIEGQGKAVLYTGDIRAETWWVNSLVRTPVLLPYTLGNRRLDCMYLDTTFATRSEPYISFPSKAEGVQELLSKVSQYPDDTVFYFHSWTFGYECVWIALSAFLGSRIHLDDYRARIYGSLSTLNRKQLREVGLKVQADNQSLKDSGIDVHEATALCGFRNGNHIQPGCLTSQEGMRIHSCERGMGCRVLDHDKQAEIVHIIPIITRVNGTDFEELGAGGGKGDLDQREELENSGITELSKLMELCTKTIEDEDLLQKVLGTIRNMPMRSNGIIDLDMQLQKDNQTCADDISVQTFVKMLSANASRNVAKKKPENRTIRFPYSRHSSYSELCELVAAFRPKDVFPCTVDAENWIPDMSMQSLFGEYCSEKTFRHDTKMMGLFELGVRQQRQAKRQYEETQNSTQAIDDDIFPSPKSVKRVRKLDETGPGELATQAETIDGTGDRATEISIPLAQNHVSSLRHMERSDQELDNTSVTCIDTAISTEEPVSALIPRVELGSSAAAGAPPASQHFPISPSLPPCSKVKSKRFTNRQLAYNAALGTVLTWADYGGLSSTRTSKDREEQEL